MKMFKYLLSEFQTIDPELSTRIVMPKGAVIRHVDKDTRTDSGALWAEVDPDAAKEDRFFRVIATCETVPTGKYLGSYKVLGQLIWHVYEVPSS